MNTIMNTVRDRAKRERDRHEETFTMSVAAP